MRVLLTGSTGFVGRTLLNALRNIEIRRALRSAETTSAEESVIVGDIGASTQWAAALAGVDCVVHLAARVHVMRPTRGDGRLFRDTNVQGTQALASAAAANGVKRFIFLSSVKVNGEATYDRPFTAADEAKPVDDYGTSKSEAETNVFEIAAKSSMEAIVIRPPLVYGPGVKANFLRLMSWVHKGIPLPLGAIRNQRSMVSVWNLCDLIKQTIEIPSVKSGVLMVSDGEDLSTPDLIRRLAVAMGRSARLVSVPESLLKVAGALTGKSAEIARLRGSLTVDISETKRQLGWTPPLSVDEGIARTVRWYLNEANARGG